jgi:large subunit ribosomal protein L3
MSYKLIGIKLGMHQFKDTAGTVCAATAIYCIPCTVIKFLSPKNLVLGYNSFFKKQLLNQKNLYTNSFEYKNTRNIFNSFTIGETLTLINFKDADHINVRAKKIGKGTLGNIKKNKFKRGPESHGSKHHRLQGSLGAGTSPGRVFPGKKMSGQDASKFSTIKKLKVLHRVPEYNTLILKGSIPGKKGAYVELTSD